MGEALTKVDINETLAIKIMGLILKVHRDKRLWGKDQDGLLSYEVICSYDDWNPFEDHSQAIQCIRNLDADYWLSFVENMLQYDGNSTESSYPPLTYHAIMELMQHSSQDICMAIMSALVSKVDDPVCSTDRKHQNHHHEVTKNQTVIDMGSGEFVADNERIPLLKALNDCGLITRTHCYGHETGESFVGILADNIVRVEFRDTPEEVSGRKFGSEKELLIVWKRKD